MSLKRLSFILPFLFLLAAITGVSASEAAESPRAPVKPSGANYAQTLYSYETGVDCLLWSNSIDWRGEYYHLKQNALRTKSYIYQNYGPSNRTNPLITLNSSVEDFEVTADPKGSYLYYQLAGDNMTVYRQPLAKSVDLKPERKEFSFGGTPFAFETFALAQNADDFLLCSAMNDGLNVTIGLFSFNGGTEPRRSWSCALPEEWGDNSESGGVKGYRVVFEATTGKLWLIASKTFRGAENGGGAKEFRWFFTGSISSEGELSPYDPAAEIPDWRVGNLKTLSVGRYGRVVTEYSNTSPKRRLSHRVFDPAAKGYREGAVTAWFDGGEERPLKDFYSSPDYDNFTASGNYKVDGKGNLYLEYAWYNQNNGTYAQRFAIFSPSD